jgi:hypothetical protein
MSLTNITFNPFASVDVEENPGQKNDKYNIGSNYVMRSFIIFSSA